MQIKANKERKDIPLHLQWDLTKIYKNEKEWEKDFSSLVELLNRFLLYKNRLSESAKTIKQAFQSRDILLRTIDRLYTYAHLLSDENKGDSSKRELLDRISSEAAKIYGSIAWFEPEILEIPEQKLTSFIKSPELSFYKRSLKKILRDKPHTLSSSEEFLLASASEIFNIPHKTFSLLNNADIRFPVIKDSEGNCIELTHGNFIKFLEDSDRNIREKAFYAMYDTYASFKNTFASILEGTIKTHVYEAKIRKFPSALSRALHPDNIPENLYGNLINTIRNNLSPLFKYYDLRRRVLKLEKIDIYDTYNPLIEECKQTVSWEQACNYIREAFLVLGDEYMANIEKAFSERWIDVMESRGKVSGAYSGGCYDSPPYILMNFQGTFRDVFTLGHELGHSMHTLLSNTTQDYHYAAYKIFVAEVASTVNEILLYYYFFDKLLENDDPQNSFSNPNRRLRLYLLNHMIDDIRATVYRQTMFAEFELILHKLVEKGRPLTPDVISEKYYAIVKDFSGYALEPNEKISMEWARIPHFHYNFYVYKYATGFTAAFSIANRIMSGDKDTLSEYIKFLKSGDTEDPLVLLNRTGVDLNKPEPYKNLLSEFDKKVEELNKTI